MLACGALDVEGTSLDAARLHAAAATNHAVANGRTCISVA
jgi:hypothetical protein